MFCQSYSNVLKGLIPLVVLSCLLGCKPSPSPHRHMSLPAVQVLTVQQAKQGRSVFIGTYEARRSILLAPTQAGRIITISAVSGQFVRKGDVLATLEDRLLSEIAAQAQGEADAAKDEMEQAKATYKRSQGLDTIGGLSSEAVEDRAHSWRISQGKYKSARAALMQAQIQLAEAQIRAPEDGWVVSVSGVPGNLVGAGSEIIRLSAGEPEVHFMVPSPSAWAVGDMADVCVSTSPNGQCVHAIISEIGAVDASSQMQNVRLKLDRSLPLAINSIVTIVIAQHQVLSTVRVPLTALILEDQTHAHLWGVTEEQEPHLVSRRVQIVGLRGADALVEGLPAGAIIVTSNDGLLKAGQQVQVINQASVR